MCEGHIPVNPLDPAPNMSNAGGTDEPFYLRMGLVDRGSLDHASQSFS